MPRLRRLTPAQVIQILEKAGFEFGGQAGGHVKLRRWLANGQKQTLIVPSHRSLKIGMLRTLVKQAGEYLDDEQIRAFYED